MNSNEIRKLETACEKALAKSYAWNPVFADVIDCCGNKIGHIVSNGYNFSDWSFYPVRRLLGRVASYADRRAQKEQIAAGARFHRSVHGKPLNNVIPKWVGKYTLKNIHDMEETK